MSTRSCIIVKIKKEDLGKVMKFNESLVRGLESWEKNESKEGYFPEITLKYPYLSVYCHWDGYLEGVGAELKEHYNTYEKALNLVLGGSISSISDGYVKHYTTRKGEDWDYLKPIPFKTLAQIKKSGDYSWCEYFYVFEDGEWKYSYCSMKSYRKLNK